MTITFESAYKALEDAKAAAKTAADEGARTGNAGIMDLARAQLSTAAAEFREKLVETVVIPAKGPILKVEFQCLEKLARDNGCDFQEVISRIEEVDERRIIEIDLSCLGLKNITSLAGLTALTNLCLNMNEISDIQPLSKLTSLRDNLDLCANQISDISALAGLKALKGLGLSGNPITDISALAGLTAMDDLVITGTKITDISALSGLLALRELWLKSNPLIVNDSLKKILKTLRKRGCSIEIEGVEA